MSAAASKALGRRVELVSSSAAPGSSTGGRVGCGGATTSTMMDKLAGTNYFVKSGRNKFKMLMAEFVSAELMAKTNTIRVPTPIANGEHLQTSQAFAIYEYLEFCNAAAAKSSKNQFQMGVQLAKMHRNTSKKGLFGFVVNNTIGATPQLNQPWKDSWADFWDKYRLSPMLQRTNNAGCTPEKIQALRTKTNEILSQHESLVVPSLLHGDLWEGNAGFVLGSSSKNNNKEKEGKEEESGQAINDDNDYLVDPVVFDPASYYGDRETDIGMTHLFGGFTSDFYKGYESEWPLPSGHEKRRTIYNLYHILNHQVLFGGNTYKQQAQEMIDEIIVAS